MDPNRTAAEIGRLVAGADRLMESFQRDGRRADLVEAVRCLDEAARLLPPDHPEFPHLELRQATALTFLQDPPSLDRALNLVQRRLPSLRPGTPLHAAMTMQAAAILRMRALDTGDPAAAAELVRLVEPLVAAPDLPPDLVVSARLCLAVGLFDRYVHGGTEAADLRRAQDVLNGIDGSTLPPGPVADQMRDLRQKLETQALMITAPSGRAVERLDDNASHPSPAPPVNFGNLTDDTNTMADAAVRFHVGGGLHELDTAIESHRQRVVQHDSFDPDRASLLTTYATLLQLRFRHRSMSSLPGASQDLREAVFHLREAVESGSGYGAPMAAAALGTCLINRSRTDLDEQGDLDEGIAMLNQAVADPRLGERLRAAHRISIAEALLQRGRRDLDPRDFEAAATELADLRDGYQLDSPLRPVLTARLAQALMLVADARGDADRADRANNEARDAARSNESLLWAYDAALGWGEWAWRQHRLADAGEAYSMAVAAMYRLASTQLNRDDSEIMLKRHNEGAAARAAYALAITGRADDAVVAVEAGRAVMLSAVLERDLVDLDSLTAAGRSDLCERYRRAVAQFAAAERDLAAEAPVPG